MYHAIRESYPDLPIILLSRPKFCPNAEDRERFAVIKATYDRAKANRDERIYFLDGTTLMAYAKNDGTVDGTHPNDLGFASMARAVGDVLERVLLH